MSFGNIIKKLRSDRNMTQEQLAEVLSISAQAVSRWETNIALPDISLLPILANFFDVTTDFLLEVDASSREKKLSRCQKPQENIRPMVSGQKALKFCEKLSENIRQHISCHTSSQVLCIVHRKKQIQYLMSITKNCYRKLFHSKKMCLKTLRIQN